MTNERLAMHTAETDPPLVEDVWEDILVEFGFERERAEQVTRLVFSNPDLTMAQRGPDEISRIIGDELASLDLSSEVGRRSRKLRSLLVDVLQSGLDGILLGPAAAPNDLADDAAGSRGEAFDAIRRSFRERNVTPERIDFAEFPSAEQWPQSAAETVAAPAPSGSSGPDEATDVDGFETNRALPQDIREPDRPGEPAERSETQEILSVVDEARTDRSPIVRKQAVQSLSELAKIPGIRADRQINKLLRAYHEESDPDVRAAIIGGLETYVHDTAGGDTHDPGADTSTDSDNDGSTGSDIDPRDAATGKFSNESE